MRRALVLACFTLAAAPAPPVAAKPANGAGAGPPQIDCAVFAAHPVAGMDAASCEAMNRSQAAYWNAAHDPAGARPGDDQMTCDQINAELMQQAPSVTAPPAEHVAQAQQDASATMAKVHQLEGEAAAASAQGAAESAAAGALSAVNPIAGRAADAAAMAHQQATQAALSAQSQAELAPREQAMMRDTARLATDMSPGLQANPRFARLIDLADQKHCRGMGR